MRNRPAVLAVVLYASLVLTSSLEAQRRPVMNVGSMLAKAREARNHDVEDSAGPSFLIPAAGNLQGANGTYFRSDVTLIHYGNGPQQIIVGWMPANTNNCEAKVAEITLDEGWKHFGDFVGETLGETGLGALVFMAVDEEGELDDTAQIDGFSRIWTPMPNGLAGTSSQQFSAVAIDDLFPLLHVYLFGLRQDAGFRTNVGIVNFDLMTHAWTAEFFPSVGARPANGNIIVPPCSMWQGAIPAGNFGPLLVHLLPRDGDGNFWTAYGSSTDNSTGDGWIVKGKHAF